MKEKGISITEMAAALDISRNQMSGVVNGRYPVTAETAFRLSKILGTSAGLWIKLQGDYDFWEKERNLPRNLKNHLNRFAKEFAKRPVPTPLNPA